MASRLVALAGPAREPFKRARKGLYAGRGRMVGNNVSFSQRKTRRVWNPNTQWTSLWSETLGMRISLRVTAHALRCIEKAGGLDEYLTQTKPERLDSDVGMMWRERILSARKVLDLVEEAKVAEGADAAARAAA